jgi:hypothetical protein
MLHRYSRVIILMLIIAAAFFPANAAFASHDAAPAPPSAAAAPEHGDAHASAGVPAAPASTTPWWVWPLSLFIVTFILGILAVLGGVGGGVYSCRSWADFPFNIDFVKAPVTRSAQALAAGRVSSRRIQHSPGSSRRAYRVGGATLVQ